MSGEQHQQQARTTGSGNRRIDRWFDSYSDDHRNTVNQWIHVVCVPAIVWSLIAILWTIPAPGTLFKPGFWAGLAMVAATGFYYRQSRRLGLGMLGMFLLMALSAGYMFETLGPRTLLWSGVGVFVVAWIGQFIGHKFEGRKPSFFTDLTYLLIGPAWVLSKLYRKIGLCY